MLRNRYILQDKKLCQSIYIILFIYGLYNAYCTQNGYLKFYPYFSYRVWTKAIRSGNYGIKS